MIDSVICTLLICATVIICILGWKYLDERDDLSYQRWNALDTKISNIEELLEKKTEEEDNESSILVPGISCGCCVMACDFLHLYSFGRFTPEAGEENF